MKRVEGIENEPCKHGHPASDRYRAPNGDLRCRSCNALSNRKTNETKKRTAVKKRVEAKRDWRRQGWSGDGY